VWFNFTWTNIERSAIKEDVAGRTEIPNSMRFLSFVEDTIFCSILLSIRFGVQIWKIMLIQGQGGERNMFSWDVSFMVKSSKCKLHGDDNWYCYIDLGCTICLSSDVSLLWINWSIIEMQPSRMSCALPFQLFKISEIDGIAIRSWIEIQILLWRSCETQLLRIIRLVHN